MEYKLQQLPRSEAEIEVTTPFQEFEPQVKRAAVLISEEVEIEGFRKGKAPYDIVAKRIGESEIYQRAADLAIRKTYPSIISELAEKSKQGGEEFIPMGRPEITVMKLAPGNELRYKVKLFLFPKIKLPDYKNIAKSVRFKKQRVEVKDEEVQKSLEWIRESRIKLVTVARPAQTGDLAEVDFEVRHGGVKIESGDSRNHPVVIGKGKFLPGFEDALMEMSAGEEKQITLVVPENWHDKSLAGKALDFKIKVNLVQERQMPELTDEFAKGLGEFASLEALMSSIRDGLMREKTNKENQRIQTLMIEEIAKSAVMEIPEILIMAELDKMIGELKSGIENMGMKWEDYLIQVKRTVEELKKDWRSDAEKRARAALCLREIASKENIAPSEEEVAERVNRFLSGLSSVKEAEKAIDPVRSRTSGVSADTQAHRTSNGIDAGELKEYTKSVLRNEKVFEFLEEL